MTYNETAVIVYRVISAYPFYTRQFTDDMVKNMVREWHEGMRNMDREGAMEAVTALIVEQKWMPTLSDVINKTLDVQYGEDADIIRNLDRHITRSSSCIIFGQVTEEQERGYQSLTNFQKLIIKSPSEFNLWLAKDYEWKEARVKLVKRELCSGKHRDFLNGTQPNALGNGFDVFKALEERKKGTAERRGGSASQSQE